MRVLTIDIGNTRTKAALFDGRGVMTPLDTWQGVAFDRAVACASGRVGELPEGTRLLGPDTRLPIAVDYDRAALGPDRLAAACGAWALAGGEDCVVVDAGTCVTVDLVRGGTYLGGAILPGISMKLQALHTKTAKLPLLYTDRLPDCGLCGKDTAGSIALGVGHGTVGAVESLTARYEAHGAPCRLLLTGGDAQLLASLGLWNGRPFALEPDLVLRGLYEIERKIEN